MISDHHTQILLISHQNSFLKHQMHNTGVKRSLRNFDSVVFKEDLEMVDWNVAHTQSEENRHVNLF